jgi:polyisoprenoid-binding protein YceI
VRRALAAAVLLASLALAAPAARSTEYRIDPARSHATFGVRLLWLRTISGRFSVIAGEVKLDPHGQATIDARITVGSIVMDSDRLRRWVLEPEFFDATQYPTIRFLSDPIAVATLTSGGTLDGQLSLRGVTLPVHFELLPVTCATLTASDCLIQARGVVSRSAFGMTSHRTALSDHVQLGFSIALDAASD